MPPADTYSFASRQLHRLALGSRAVMETSLDLEIAAFSGVCGAQDDLHPVYVCGLARGGTSLVTRLLDSSGLFASTRYRDMPFPLAPNLWAALSGKARTVPAHERDHGDGLMHDLMTPEALEEVFWRCFEGRNYILQDRLIPLVAADETLDRYRRWMCLVQHRDGGRRYLAKANNAVLRLGSLIRACPNALFIHPFQSPGIQTRSLLRQHLDATRRHQEDRFSRSYDRWLGHHEFGLEHRPMQLAGEPQLGDPTVLGYWNRIWSDVHGYLLDQPPAVSANQIFLDVDALRQNPQSVLERLAVRLAIGGLDDSLVRRGVPEGVADRHADRQHSLTLAELRRRAV